ncbi:methyltransferase family protein [Streptomyces sp. NBC_00344]|uniref:methyltransferase family protein n=1 Tax=Streptomyces sp. NBC_00344 TaxID=2975720 RepID=UPI003FA72CC8
MQVSQAVYVVAKLNMPTMLDEAGGPLPVSALAERCGAHIEPLRRLLRALAARPPCGRARYGRWFPAGRQD